MAAVPLTRIQSVLKDYPSIDVNDFIKKCTVEKFEAEVGDKNVTLIGPVSPLWDLIAEFGGKWKKSYRSWVFSRIVWDAIVEKMEKEMNVKNYELTITEVTKN